MAPNPVETSPTASEKGAAPGSTWSTKAKWIVSGIVILQLLAVVAEPFRFFSHSPARGTSQAAQPARVVLGPYVEFAYLDHGYFFFAPEPGASHLIQCSLILPEGKTATLRYPDKNAQWPRLLYHRHFMLSEHLNQLYVPPVDPVAIKQAPPIEANNWSNGRQRYEMVRNSMQSHLKARYSADSVTIERLRHDLPGDIEVLQQKLPLNDPRFYIVLPDSLAIGDPMSAPLSPMSPIARPLKPAGGEKVEAPQ